jgi:hypothetical protein
MKRNSETQVQPIFEKLVYYYRDNPNVNLGIIGMELVEEASTLFQVEKDIIQYKKDLLSNFFGNLQYQDKIDKDIQEINNKLANLNNICRYALLKLALDTEYSQNDFHKSNIMIMNDPSYFHSPGYENRPVLIDFGRAVKIPPNTMKEIRKLVEDFNYSEALKKLCDSNFAHDTIHNIANAKKYYGWVCGDYNMSDTNYDDYINKMTKVYKKNTKHEIMKHIPKPKALLFLDIMYINKLFSLRENAIDINISIMNKLHDETPNKYPLLPVSNQIKNSLYNGMIGGFHNRKRRNAKKNTKTNIKKTRKQKKTNKTKNTRL